MLERHSAIRRQPDDARESDDAAMQLREMRPAACMVIAGWDAGFDRRIERVRQALALGEGVPSPGTAAADGSSLLAPLAPRRCLAATTSPATARALDGAVDADSRIDWLCARTWLRLTGAGTDTLLDRQVPVDLREGAFPPNAAAQTVIAGVDVLLCALARGPVPTFDLLVGRSYAASFTDHLADAATCDGGGLALADGIPGR